MIGHWLTTGWRSLVANPLFSLITIASLSIGCCGALLAGANIRQHLAFERWVPDAGNIAKVTLFVKGSLASYAVRGRDAGAEGDGVFAAALMAAPLANVMDSGRFPEIAAQTRVFPASIPVKGYSEDARPKGISVDTTFFDVFDLPVLAGDARAALAAPDKIVLTESLARKLFGSTDVIGKLMPLVDDPRVPRMTVGAVIRDLPLATHLEIEAIVGPGNFRGLTVRTSGLPIPEGPPGGGQAAFQNTWRLAIAGSQYVRFDPSFDFKAGAPAIEETLTRIAQTADGAIPGGAAQSQIDRIALVPLLDLHLAGPENTGLPSSGDMLLLVTLGGAAVALLGVSAFNYVVLSLARSLRRRKEVALRKVLGASNGALVRHYLAEAAMVAALSIAIGFAAAELLQPWFARALAQPDTLVNLYDRWFLGIGGAVLIALVLAAGSYPAFYLAGVRPRAGLENTSGDNLGPVGRTVTSGLLALQVAAATILLAISLTMAAQARYVSERPLGFITENMYRLNNSCLLIRHGPDGRVISRSSPGGIEQAQCRARRVADLRTTPGVDAVSSFSGVIANAEAIATEDYAVPGGTNTVGKAARLSVDTDFLQTVGAKLLAGRFFDPDSAYDRRLIDNWIGQPDPSLFSTPVPVIVTRATLPLVGAETPEDAIGKRLGPLPGSGAPPITLEIVGVVEDWHQRSLRYKTNPLIFVPGAGALAPILSIKPENLEAVTERIKELPPKATGDAAGVPAPVLTPLAAVFEEAYASDTRLMFAVLGFAGVAILVACLGVYGLTAFDMRRRVREIGIRKALGATPGKVAGMVLGRQIVFASIASLLAWPVAYWLANGWLVGYVYRTSLGPVVLPLASLIVVGFVAIAVSLNSARASAIRPSHALRAAT